MTPDRRQKIEQVYNAALERKASQRAAFLQEACAGDEALRREVESLLAQDETGKGFLDSPAFAVAAHALAQEPTESLVGRQLGSYYVLSKIGEGGMGEVYRAKDIKLRREVALKVLPKPFARDPERLARFEREAQILASLNHRNIAAIYGLENSDGVHFLVLELVEGETLAERIVRSGPLSAPETLGISKQVADALEYAHKKAVTHRDIKPANIKVTPEGEVKVLDFGLAKIFEGDRAGVNLSDLPTLGPGPTKDGQILGTPAYMSPEQVRGQEVDKRTDIWAFGCLLYELLTGQRAFQSRDREGAGTLADIIAAVLNNEPNWEALPPATPATLRTLLRRCLQKEAKRRLQDVGDVRIEVEEALTAPTALEATAASVPVAPRAAIPRWFRAPAWLGVGIAFVAALIGVFLLSHNANQPPPRFQQITFAHGNITGARFAADGQSVIYGAAWAGNPPGLYTTLPGSPESRSLGLLYSGIWSVSPSGEVAISVGCTLNWGDCTGTLALMPSAGGLPHELLENVHAADWAPDGKTLAVAQFVGGKDRLQYPIGKVLYETTGWVTHVRVSPKGDRIAFLDHPILGQIAGSVCVLDLTGKKTTLSSGWKGLQGLAWSATGDEIWFTASAVNPNSHSLRAVSLSGREREIFQSPGNLMLSDISRDGRQVLLRHRTPRAVMVGLAPGEQKERELSWFEYSTAADLSADGRTVLFYEWGGAVRGNLTVYLRRTDGSDAVRLGEGKPLALSPDGKWALALPQTSPPQLVLLPTGPGEQKLLPRGAIREFFDWAAWSPDAGRIFFAAEEAGHRRRTYVQDIQGGPPQPVTPEGMVGTLLSPDGKLIAAVGRYGEYYLCPVGGGEPQPLEGYADGDTLLQWSGDGRSLFLRAAGDMELKIFRLDLNSGRREFWKDLTPPHPAGLIGIATDPGQVRLTPDGKSYVYTYWISLGELYLAEGLK